MKHAFKLKWLLSGAAVLLLAVYFAIPEPTVTANELKFQQMRHGSRWGYKIERLGNWVESYVYVPDWLDRLGSRFLNRWQTQYRELQRSGYLTNAVVTVTNWPSTAVGVELQKRELLRRIRLGLPPDTFFGFSSATNACGIVCRTNDLLLIQRAVNQQ